MMRRLPGLLGLRSTLVASFRRNSTLQWRPLPETPTHLWQRTLEIHRRDLCGTHEVLQPFRMRDSLYFFDTRVRLAVRATLSKSCFIYSSEHKHHVMVYGPAGTGKSHNLAVFVLEMRAEGHLVMYLSEVDSFLDLCSMILFDEFEFAWQKFRDHHYHTAKEQDAAKGQKAAFDAVDAKISAYKASSAYINTGANYGERDVHELCTLVGSLQVAAEYVGKRLLLVFDQDNYLTEPIRNSQRFVAVHYLISYLPCHALVLCASANNEIWDSRKLLVYHGIDAVPEVVLRTHWHATDKEIEFLTKNFNLYPMPVVGLLSQPYRAEGTVLPSQELPWAISGWKTNRSLPIVFRDDLKAFANIILTEISDAFGTFLHAKEPSYWKSVYDIDTVLDFQMKYDRRFMTQHHMREDILRAIYPLAQKALESIAKEKLTNAPHLFRLLSTPKAYKDGFALLARTLFAPKQGCNWEDTSLQYDSVPSQEVINEFWSRSAPDARHYKLWIEPCHGAPNVDFYLLEKLDRTISATVFKLTLRSPHSASHRKFVSDAMLQRLRNNGVNGKVYFVYVSPGISVKDSEREGQYLQEFDDCFDATTTMPTCGLRMLQLNFQSHDMLRRLYEPPQQRCQLQQPERSQRTFDTIFHICVSLTELQKLMNIVPLLLLKR